jgi:hypothetical protein
LCRILDKDRVVTSDQQSKRFPIDRNTIKGSDNDDARSGAQRSLQRFQIRAKRSRIQVVKTNVSIGPNSRTRNVEAGESWKSDRRFGIDSAAGFLNRDRQSLRSGSAKEDGTRVIFTPEQRLQHRPRIVTEIEELPGCKKNRLRRNW